MVFTGSVARWWRGWVYSDAPGRSGGAGSIRDHDPWPFIRAEGCGCRTAYAGVGAGSELGAHHSIPAGATCQLLQRNRLRRAGDWAERRTRRTKGASRRQQRMAYTARFQIMTMLLSWRPKLKPDTAEEDWRPRSLAEHKPAMCQSAAWHWLARLSVPQASLLGPGMFRLGRQPWGSGLACVFRELGAEGRGGLAPSGSLRPS